MEAIHVHGKASGSPEEYILPVEYAQEGAASPPTLVKYWQWVVGTAADGGGRWVLVHKIGGMV